MASTSTWQWVGSFIDIEKTYQQNGVETTELRREGTRQRIVQGYAMEAAGIKQCGDLEDTVTAYNGAQASVLSPVAGVAKVQCVEETFVSPGSSTVAFFVQTQKWTAWLVTT